MMRFLGLAISSLLLFLTLLPAATVLEIEDPRRSTMTLFYMSIVMALFLSYIFSSAGRACGLSMSSGGTGFTASFQSFGVPLFHRHAWGDFGRLYAQLFLVYMAPILIGLFVLLVASAFAGFEQTIEIQTEEALLEAEGLPEEERKEIEQRPTESEALRQIADGSIALGPADQARVDRVFVIAAVGFGLACAFIMPCFTRLVPFYFWRSGGRQAATLAETWRRVSWSTAVAFGWLLLAGLVPLFFIPTPLWVRYGLACILFAVWAFLLARQVGEYDKS